MYLDYVPKHPEATPRLYPCVSEAASLFASQVKSCCFMMHTVEQSVAPQNLDRVLREVWPGFIELQLP